MRDYIPLNVLLNDPGAFCNEHTLLHSLNMHIVVLIRLLLIALAKVNAAPRSSPANDGPSLSLSKPTLVEEDDPRFSMRSEVSSTKLPPTAVLMCAIELAARYAEKDYLGPTTRRQGIVLPQYPQVEIAVIPVPPARTIQVRLVMYAIYGIVLDMMFGDGFYETEVEILWDDEVKAHMYFTLPLDKSSLRQDGNPSRNLFTWAMSMNNASIIPEEETSVSTTTTTDPPPLGTIFDWRPVYKPNGENMPLFGIFLLCLGAIKTVARFPITARIPEPVHIGSELVSANLQIWPEVRARATPPYFRYGHVLEAARRIPGWQLERRRFAEFFCGIEANGVPLGVIVLEKGRFDPGLGEIDGDVTTS
ncbi:MAG: hypothetical protein Q9169_008476 [Polycauliona sp. 2 TL-2023]